MENIRLEFEEVLYKEIQEMTDHETVLFAAQYAYSMANLPTGINKVEDFREPPSMVYEQYERALKRWKKQQVDAR